jgi:hypothetical protein
MRSRCSAPIRLGRNGHVRRCGLAVMLLPALVAFTPAPSALARGAGLVGSAAAVSHGKPTRKPAGTTVTVAVDRTHPGAVVPGDFLGLSFEMSSLPQIARYGDRGDLVTLLRSLGPGVLRFGGVSADTRIAWTDARTPRPAWASDVVDADDFRELGALAAASGWHVVLTLGIVHYEPQAAAREAAAAKAALGESLEGIEIGNEPNAYALHGMRAEPWSFAQYAEEAAAYRSAIEAAAPGIPLLGPDVSGSSAFETWGPAEVVEEQPTLLTGHHYPLGCEQQPPPSIERLLSPPIQRKEVGSLRTYMKVARAANTPFRLDETNTVSCGGVAGISDTFASALWAAGYLPRVMAMGVAGVNLHGNPSRCSGYSPVCAPGAAALSEGELVAQPEWYALLLVKELIGTRPLPTTVLLAPRGANVQAMGFLAADGSLRFMLVDDDPSGSRGVVVQLRVGAGVSGGSVLALSGPSLAALSGVQLGEREVAPDGSWSAGPLPRLSSRAGTLSVALAAGSAAVVRTAPSASTVAHSPKA